MSSADRDARIAAGKWVKCSRCGGYGVHEIFEGIADCKQCNGGYVWEYPRARTRHIREVLLSQAERDARIAAIENFHAIVLNGGGGYDSDIIRAQSAHVTTLLAELRAVLPREGEAKTFVVVKNGVYNQGTFGPFATEIDAKTAAQGYANADSDDYHDWDVCVMGRDGLGDTLATFRHSPTNSRGQDWTEALKEEKWRSVPRSVSLSENG